MRIDDVDPAERDDRPRRRWPWIVVPAALAAGAGAIVVSTRDGEEPLAVAVTSTTAAPPETDPPIVFPPFQPNVAPLGFPDWGSDYTGAELKQLYERTTESGFAVVVQDIGEWGAMEGGVFIGDNVRVPGQPVAPGGWEPPGWCNPIGSFRVTMRFKDAVGTSQGQRYSEAREGLTPTLFSSGFAEGTPFRVLVLQVSDDVRSVAVRFGDGAADVASPEKGWLALAVPGAQEGRFELTVVDGSGSRVVGWKDIPTQGDQTWMDECTPPPPEMPPAGEQPADPAAIEALIRDRFELLWDVDVPREDKPDDLLDDWTGVDAARDELLTGSFGEVARTAERVITGFVFTSPTQAWFRYDINTSITNFSDRFGYANLIDGAWRIGRAVMCQDLALASVQCQPSVETIQPPAPAEP
jgi:hypothetical protein